MIEWPWFAITALDWFDHLVTMATLSTVPTNVIIRESDKMNRLVQVNVTLLHGIN